jgi:hypothetical protein
MIKNNYQHVDKYVSFLLKNCTIGFIHKFTHNLSTTYSQKREELKAKKRKK